MNKYVIPYQDSYIVYRPLIKLAFLANAALVNLIADLSFSPGPATGDRPSSEAIDFLERIGYFEPDPPAPPDPDPTESFRPTIAILFPTNACNFGCVYCYAMAGEAKRETLPFDIGKKAIDIVHRNAVDLGEDHFSVGFHGGGEPTLNQPLLAALVEYARGKNPACKVQLTSNGRWNPDQRDWILTHIDEISLSFDGLPHIQNRQRPMAGGGPTFDDVMTTIRHLDARSIPYGIRMTVMDESIDDLPRNFEFLCAETKCQAFQVEPAFNHGRAARDGTAVTQAQRFADVFSAAWEIADNCGRHMYYSGARPWAITSRFCQAPETALIVGPDGFLTSCYEICSRHHELADEFIFGDLTREGGCVIRQDDRDRLASRIAARRDLCRDCFCFWHCAGDCPSKTFTPGSDGHLYFGERCDINRAITRDLILHYIAQGGGVWREDEGRGTGR